MLLSTKQHILKINTLCLENGRDQGPNQSEVLRGENYLDQPWISRWVAPAEGWLPTSPSRHGQHQHRLHIGKLWSHLMYFCLLIQHYQVTLTFLPILFYSFLFRSGHEVQGNLPSHNNITNTSAWTIQNYAEIRGYNLISVSFLVTLISTNIK